MFILIFLAIHCLIWVAFSYAFRGKLNLDKRGKLHLDNDKKWVLFYTFICFLQSPTSFNIILEEKRSHSMKVVSKIFGIIFIFFAALSFLSKFEFKLLQIGSVFDLLPLSLIIKMGFPDREAFNNFIQPYRSIAIGILLAIGIMLIHLSFGPKRRLGSITPHYGALAFLKNLLFFLSLLFSGFFVTPLILGGIFRFPVALPEALSFMGKGIIPIGVRRS